MASWILVPIVAGQGPAIPSQWMGTTSNLSRASREALASGAATALTAYVDPNMANQPNTGTTTDLPQLKYVASVFAVLTLQDHYSGNLTWNDTVTNGLLDYYQENGLYGKPPNTLNSDAIYWGLTFFYAYRTYRQHSLLDLAIVAYNATYVNGFISPSAAESGTGAGRNVSFSPPSGCSGTYAGGVFWTEGVQNNTEITAYTIAPFLALSAYLYEETNQSVYQEAAQLSADFAINHLWNGTAFSYTFYPLSCTMGGDWITISQWLIEGLAVWANVTRNETLTSFLDVAVSNTTTYSVWSLEDGVNQEGLKSTDYTSIDKGIFVRALVEARNRNPGTALATYIEAYITVQFNALLDHARDPNTDFYSTAWIGPPASSFIAGGNIAALDVLNAAFSFVEDASAPSSSSHKSNKAGVIAASTVSAIVASTGFAIALYFWRQRRVEGSANHAEPYMVQSTTLPSTKWNRFYAPHRDEPPASWAITSEAGPAPTSTLDGGYERGLMTELSDQVRRLYDLVQHRRLSVELPPQYND
ncbi:unnamed protein product [Peniophora sp. CBMAI 1063]|nr:unnamed protein product [Peniophora sp. CBMAI 1063]